MYLHPYKLVISAYEGSNKKHLVGKNSRTFLKLLLQLKLMSKNLKGNSSQV
jgi:hypothetical protein